MSAHDDLTAKAGQTGSSAVVVTKGAETIVDWTDDGGHRPVETMSVTKTVVGIVTGAAVGDGGPDVLYRSVVEWIPEWKDDPRSAITLEALLGHRSGLRAVPPPEFVDEPDAYKLALALPLDQEPGGPFLYNNSAFNLIGVVVHRATGWSIAEVAERKVFGALDFGPWDWVADAAGNPRCHFGLNCNAVDLSKVGRLFLDPLDIVPRSWPQTMLERSLSFYPQSAWVRGSISQALVERWLEAGIDASLVESVAVIVGKRLDFDALQGALVEATGERWPTVINEAITRGLPWFDGEFGPVAGYGHDGDGGQQLIVMADRDAVAVRQRENLESGSAWSGFPGDALEAAA